MASAKCSLNHNTSLLYVLRKFSTVLLNCLNIIRIVAEPRIHKRFIYLIIKSGTNMKHNIFIRIYRFYIDGFRNMSSWGRQVWIVILIKLFIMFFILKLFFFPDLLQKNFDTDEQRSNYVLEQLTK